MANKNYMWQEYGDGFHAIYSKTGSVYISGKEYIYRAGELAFITNNKKAFSEVSTVVGGLRVFVNVFASHNIFSGCVVFKDNCQLTVLDNDDTLNIVNSIFSGDCNVLVTDFNGVWDCDIENSVIDSCEIVNSHVENSVISGMQLNRSKVHETTLLCPNVRGNQFGHIVQINRENISPMSYYPYSEKTDLVMLNHRIINISKRAEVSKESVLKVLGIPAEAFDECIKKTVDILEDAGYYAGKYTTYMQVLMTLYEYYVNNSLKTVYPKFISCDIAKQKAFAIKGVVTKRMLDWFKTQEDIKVDMIKSSGDLFFI